LYKLNETKSKIIKNKLISLYDGNIETAKELSIDELIEHIAFRLNQLKTSRGISTSAIK
jgi:hypothetical protein